MPRYDTERALVSHFSVAVRSASGEWGDLNLAYEFDYQRGRADVIAVNSAGVVTAVEAKLSKWRVALHQAYRNRCFAHHSYVLLPQAPAFRAAVFASEFMRRSVGLCYVDDHGTVITLLEAPRSSPLQAWLLARAIVHVRDNE